MLKNTAKLFGNNFILVWKQLLYMCIILLITFGIATLIALPVINMIKANGWFVLVDEFIETIYTSPKEIADSFVNLFASLWHILVTNFKAYWVGYSLIVFVLLFISKMLYNISYYAIGSVLEGKMSAFAKYSYTNKLVSNLPSSIGYAFFQILYSIPFYGLYLVFGFLYGKLASNILSAILTLPLLAILFVLIRALHISLFSGMIPSMIVDNQKSVHSLKNGFNAIAPRFGRIFSSALLLVLLEFLALSFFGIFTLGAGLIILLPAIPVIEVIFSMVAYYSAKKNRYYLNENLIVNPL